MTNLYNIFNIPVEGFMRAKNSFERGFRVRVVGNTDLKKTGHTSVTGRIVWINDAKTEVKLMPEQGRGDELVHTEIGNGEWDVIDYGK